MSSTPDEGQESVQWFRFQFSDKARHDQNQPQDSYQVSPQRSANGWRLPKPNGFV